MVLRCSWLKKTTIFHIDKVWMYDEEIMTNDDNLESNLPILVYCKMCCLVQVELHVFTARWKEMY